MCACINMYTYAYTYIHAYMDAYKHGCVLKKTQQLDFSFQINYIGFLLYGINRPHYIKSCPWDCSNLSYILLLYKIKGFIYCPTFSFQN